MALEGHGFRVCVATWLYLMAVGNTCWASRKAATDYSPWRQPWVEVGNEQAPKGRKNSCDTVFSAMPLEPATPAAL